MNVATADALLAKYDVPAPRYTSYPTVACWERTPSEGEWLEQLSVALARGGLHGAALYVHIPFCRSLCTFCGCNLRIVRNHSAVGPYLQALLAELDLYRTRLARPQLSLGELYLGGGTPTFLSVAELETLLAALFERVSLKPAATASVEADPRVTTAAQLAVFARYGFRHLSLGVQDFDPSVQQIVHRVQSEQQVREISEAARALGFGSVSYDLIYGLPLQTRDSIRATMDAVCRLRPDRVALYGYAHVPWIRPGQRRFTEADLPSGEQRRALYQVARARLRAESYQEIGLGYFALAGDALWQAYLGGRLHRNFMGYTEAFTSPLIGLGVSAIGDAGKALAQNEKDLQRYQARVARSELPIQRGHLLDPEDRVLRGHILRLTTELATSWQGAAQRTPYLSQAAMRLAEPAADGLVELTDSSCRVTLSGRAFLRNICMAFDARLARRLPQGALFRRDG